jgi:hypothetical protein
MSTYGEYRQGNDSDRSQVCVVVRSLVQSFHVLREAADLVILKGPAKRCIVMRKNLSFVGCSALLHSGHQEEKESPDGYHRD